MMKYKGTASNSQKSTDQAPFKFNFGKAEDRKKQPPQEMIQRLALGEKPVICRKEMLKLTKKNYMKLPENQKKDIDTSKKEALLKRQSNVKALEIKRLAFIRSQRDKKMLRD